MRSIPVGDRHARLGTDVAERGDSNPDGLAPMPHFECGTINRSATSPTPAAARCWQAWIGRGHREWADDGRVIAEASGSGQDDRRGSGARLPGDGLRLRRRADPRRIPLCRCPPATLRFHRCRVSRTRMRSDGDASYRDCPEQSLSGFVGCAASRSASERSNRRGPTRPLTRRTRTAPLYKSRFLLCARTNCIQPRGISIVSILTELYLQQSPI